ncbi:MAG: choice-of-anchor J domain-containing protein [Muribaculaceae bacterium]|nr:choice-of-anchor J domain-containing protein [Muribaculaceae bacterium]
MQQNYNKKRKLNKLKRSLLMLMMVLFAGTTMAQQTNIYMKDGNRTIQRGDAVINFYDSHGPSQQTNYWETWYAHNESFTFVFKPAVTGDKIKVTFKPFAAYAEPADPNSAIGDPIGNWTLRLNDDVLTIYNGNGAVDENIIAELTGNTQQGFSVMTDGPVTFKFESNSRYREEGWYATVELVQGNMAPQAPLIQRSTCSDQAEIFSGTYNSRIIYSIGDNDPDPSDPLAPPTYEYTAPISFPEGTIPSTGFKVNAMSQLAAGGAWSSVTHAVFQESDRVPIPDASNTLAHTTITREAGTNTIVMTPAGRPTGLNDTYEVRYTMSTNGTEPAEPTYNNSTAYTGPITATVNGTIFKAKTFAVSCHNQCSAASVRYVVDGIYAPAPVIDFNAMTISATEGTTTFDILYTVDGTDPAISGTTLTGTFSDGTVNLSSLNPALTYGQTVKALAYMASDANGTPNANYTPSQVVSAIYVPTDANGNTVNGVYGNIVLLDDREDHSWAYYSDENNPIHSLTPADVKITYTGYGEKTMTGDNTDDMPTPYYGTDSKFDQDVDAGDVAVNVGEPGNQFIYLKTLENDDPEGVDNTYSYTMIPNPFQVRPTYEGTRGEGNMRGNRAQTVYVLTNTITAGNKYLIVNAQNTGSAYALGHSNATIQRDPLTINAGNSATNNAVYISATDVDATSIWTVGTGYTFKNGSYYIYGSNTGNTGTLSCNTNSMNWNWNQDYYRLSYTNGSRTFNIQYYYSNFTIRTNNSSVYLYEERTITDPNNIIISPTITGGSVAANYAQAYQGTTVTLTITPNGNNTINSVTVTGNTTGNTITVSGNGNTRTFTMPDEDVTVNASFNNAWNINVTSTTGGLVTANPSSAVPGTTITLTITTNTGCTFTSITATGVTTGNTITLNGTGNTRTFSMPNEAVNVHAIFNDPNAKYRGFYAWRVKSLSSGLTITDADNNTYGVNSIIYADQEIEFVTSNAEGNEVEFEALWAQAFLNSDTYVSNSGNYKNAYERNFKVGTSITTYDYPVTFSTLNPDGSGTAGSISVGSNYTCSNDVKFENITFTNATSRTFTAAGNDLIFGRGISGTVNRVQGISNTSNQSALNYRMRIETGIINYLSMTYGTAETTSGPSVGGLNRVVGILGCDYDRANSNNNYTQQNQKLRITNGLSNGCYVRYTDEGNQSRETCHVTIKSGYFLENQTLDNAKEEESYYLSHDGRNNSYCGQRTLIIEGGSLLCIAGGQDANNDPTKLSLYLRMKGGETRGSIYGGSAFAAMNGDRKMVFTGGDVKGWIAVGSNGRDPENTGGYLENSDGYLYLGGNTVVNSNGYNTNINTAQGGNVFGAGVGNAAQETTGSIRNTTVVIADNAKIQRDVYGGGNYGLSSSSATVYIKGTSEMEVSGNVFGGSNQKGGATNGITVDMISGVVKGNIYGGSNTKGTVSGLATVNISGGTVKGSVYGGGCGSSTIMSNNTKVTVTGGDINNNMYGGGEEGDVSGNAVVSFEGGSVTDIYGAGKGTASNIAQGTTVNVKGGVVNGAVYGGGENGTVAYGGTSYGSTVSVSGGEVKKDVFGGGKLGTTNGATTVNISGTWDGTVIRGDVFAGAYGSHGSIYVAGKKTLNISGGRIYGSVYGGSRNANDGNTLNATGGTDATSITNICGGRIDQHVYAAGYYGSTKGSVYAFIGLSAINDAPNHSKTTGFSYDKGSILIGGSVWAGGDWGVFSGSFGAPTISGNSNIYINGEGYSTDGNDQSAANYMNIQGSILGCGTSCDAGEGKRVLILSHYGADVANSGADSDQNPFAYASRDVNSIQRFHNVIFDDAHLGFIGMGKVNSLDNTAKYALYEIDQNVYLANGSTMVMNVPSSQIYSFHSVTCTDTYADEPAFTPVAYNGLGTPGGETDNKIRVNGGSYIEIRYEPENGGSGGEPGGEGETLTYDFEDGTLQGWTNIDANNDGNIWRHSHDVTGVWDNPLDNSGHGDSYGFAFSESYVNGGAGAVTPDNYLVSPQITLGGSITFWATDGNDAYGAEHFGVYVSTNSNTNPSDFTQLQEWTLLSKGVRSGRNTKALGGTWYEYLVDLSGYSGNGYVAIRHFNCNDQWILCVDDISITLPAEEPENPEQPTVTYAYEYGELSGYAHMMAGNPDEDATCAFARPKQSQEEGNILPAGASDFFNNADGNWTSLDADGGFVSYNGSENEYTIAGVLVSNGNSDQMRYENHYPNMRDNSEYYRIWHKGGDHYTIEAVANVHATGGNDYKTVEVEVELPSWGAAGSYFRFDRTNNPGVNNTLIDYGSDVMCFNGANYSNPLGDETWMYYDDDANQQVTGVTATNATVAAAIGANGILSNPNLNFGLVIEPGKTMKTTDVNYIINSEADNFLASVEKPFNCQDNTHKPTIKLVLTYSDKLSANATLDPVLIKLVQCNAQGEITEYVTIKLIINTSMELSSGFTTQIYARMDGSASIRETSMVPVVLPTFNVAQSGENAQFYLQKVEFIQNNGVVLESAHGSSVVCAEARESASSSGTGLNIDRFAMTISALPNPDNTDDWRNITGPQDAVQQPNNGYGTLVWGGSNNRGVHLGDGKGRNPLSFAITMYFNSNEEAPGKSKMGDMVFTIEVHNIEGGTGTNNSATFTITVEVYRLGPGANFYVDGINGQDLDDADRAKFPDKAAKTVNFIFNRLGYMPGDNIFVVNELPINKNITWDGSKFQNNVKIYRYPGGHKLTTGGTSTDTNPNGPYNGPLVDVTNTLHMKGVIMDGMYAESTAPVNGVHNSVLYPTGDAGNCTYDGIAEAPLITISNGARANLTDSKLQNNYNSKTDFVNAGGAVHVDYEGILAMNSANRITGNYNVNGGGVYVDGSMIVSDYVYVFNNYKQAASGSKADPEQNNVQLAPVSQGTTGFRVVQLGTSDSNDAYDELLQSNDAGETKIGVTKDDWDHAYDGYMPVTYAEPGSLTYLNDPYSTQSMVVHDGGKFKLERYVSSEYSDSPNYLYWLETWVTAVTSEPNGFNKDQIDTPEELAWAISIVNGENGCTPAPNTSFTLTDDIDMAANIWVPIGTETALYNGTFEGNGHVVTGLRGTITRTDMGMFGRTDANANIQNMVVSTKFNTNSDNLGTVVGNMTGGVLSNVEGAGENTSRNSEGANGGLVGINSGTIHSCFSVATIKGGQNLGGLVGVNNNNLFNSYSAATMREGHAMAGLVATNNGRVENCYDATDAAVAFASKNNGTIRYCYASKPAEGDPTYLSLTGDGSTLEKHGTYGAVANTIKDLNYMYGDNKVTAAENQTIGYVKSTHDYVGNHTVVWDGLLSVLNQWVADGNVQGKPAGLSTWNRPINSAINGDLPVLAFPKDNCLGTEDGKFLKYSAFNLEHTNTGGDKVEDAFDNGLDGLLEEFNALEDGGDIFLYGNATEVANVPGTKVNVTINEDAVLLQAANAGDFTATVGVTFDNSCKTAGDYIGNTLTYDWHFMSSALQDAPINATFGDPQGFMHDVNITGMDANCYFPNGLPMTAGNTTGVQWDFYTYSEKHYHWINLKRNDHFYQESGQTLSYANETSFVPGKGYMMAISQDSYMNSTGKLNNANVPIAITSQEPLSPEYNKGWNLVGNPYQAYLDLQALLDDTDNKDNATQAYVYDADEKAYVPFVKKASDNPRILQRYVHQHQGFFVHSEKDNATLTFKPSMATATIAEGYTAPYFRGDDRINYPLVNLFAENVRGNRDLAVIEFNRPELGGATKVNGLRNANFQLAASLEGHRYGLVFTPEGTEKVPVHFTTEEDGTFTLTWETLHGDFTSLLLVDNMTGTITDMLRADRYTFDASKDDYASRFYITYTVTAVDEYNEGDGSFAFFDGSEWVVNGKGQLDIVDVTGRVLFSKRLANEHNRVSLNGVANGVYLMRVTDGKNTMVQKIVVK